MFGFGRRDGQWDIFLVLSGFPLRYGLAGHSAPPPRDASPGLALKATSCGPDLHIPALPPEGTLPALGGLSLSAGWPGHHSHQRGLPVPRSPPPGPGHPRAPGAPGKESTWNLLSSPPPCHSYKRKPRAARRKPGHQLVSPDARAAL